MSPALRTERLTDAAELLRRARGHLEAEEVLHARMLGVLGQLEREPDADADLLLATEGGTVAAVAVRTPPWPLQVSRGPEEAIRALASHLAAEGATLDGVIGPLAASRTFATAWAELTGAAVREGMANRNFACTEVALPRPVPGSMRRGTAADRELLADWLAAFYGEALPDDPLADPGGAVDRAVAEPPELGGLWLWELDDEPVAMAGTTGATRRGIRILAVYTPPELRGRGYASNLVAALTRQELDRGRAMVFLSTDLANPTSNAIYTAMGYRPVGDEQVLRFG